MENLKKTNLNFFINTFSIFSLIFIFIQFERYKDSSEKWDIFLFLILIFTTLTIIFLLYKAEFLFEKRNLLLSFILIYSIFKSISTYEYRPFQNFDYPSYMYIWLGFGPIVLLIGIFLIPIIYKLLLKQNNYFKVIKISMSIYLFTSLLLGVFQTNKSLIDFLHSNYIFDEIFSVLVGQVPFVDFIPQYQTLFIFISSLLKTQYLNLIINFNLFLFFISSLFVAIFGIFLVKNSNKDFDIYTASILVLPLVLVSPPFYSRLSSGGTIFSLLSSYPVRLLPFFLLFILFKKHINQGMQKNDKYLYLIFYLSGLNVLNNFEFGITTFLSYLSILLFINFFEKGNSNNYKLIKLLFFFLFGFLSIPIIYKLFNIDFNFNYLGWFTKNFSTSNILGTKIDIPGPGMFILPLGFTLFLSHIYIYKKNYVNNLISFNLRKNSLFGILIGSFFIFSLPYYINNSCACGQLQIFLILIAISFGLFLGSYLDFSKKEFENFNFSKKEFKNLNFLLFSFITSLIISAIILAPTPKKEFERIASSNNWPNEELVKLFNEIEVFKKNSSITELGYYGSYSRIVEFKTKTTALSPVSGIENLINNSEYDFQNYLYNLTCNKIKSKNFNIIIVDTVASKYLEQQSYNLCGAYELDNKYKFSEITILKIKNK